MKKIFLRSFYLGEDKKKIFIIHSKSLLNMVDSQEFSTVNLETIDSFKAMLIATLQYSIGAYIIFENDFIQVKDIHKITDCSSHVFIPSKSKNKIDFDFFEKCFNRL